MSDLDLDAIEVQARHWDHLVRDDPETTLALVAEVRRLRGVLDREMCAACGNGSGLCADCQKEYADSRP